MSGNHSNGGGAPSYRLDDQVGFILRRASQRHLSIFASRIGDLTPTQFASLAKMCEVGPISQNELGRRTAMDGATIKGVIDRLRKRGLAKTRPDKDDLRRVFVEPTSEGEKLFRDCVEEALQITDDTLAPLSSSEQARFLVLLNKLT